MKRAGTEVSGDISTICQAIGLGIQLNSHLGGHSRWRMFGFTKEIIALHQAPMKNVSSNCHSDVPLYCDLIIDETFLCTDNISLQ
jgi:hypothetical protein